MARDLFVDTILLAENDAQGKRVARPLTNIQVSVFQAETTTAVAIYTGRTGASQKPNPFNTVDGAVEFWVESGEYDIRFTDNNIPSRIATKTIGFEALSAAAGGISLTSLPTIPSSKLGAVELDKIPTIPNSKLDTIEEAKLSTAVQNTLPEIGDIKAGGYATARSGWLHCDGSAVSRTTYAALFSKIGTAYGVGDSSTTFNLPDLRGRSIVGLGAHATVNALGKNDGKADASRDRSHAHLVSQHTHTINHVHAVLGNAPRAGQEWAVRADAGGTYILAAVNTHTHTVSGGTGQPENDLAQNSLNITGEAGGGTTQDVSNYQVAKYFIRAA